jgi:hypothetical protein
LSFQDDTFLFYRRDFEASRIFVTEIYPDNMNWTLYDNTPETFKSMKPTFVPISIFNASKPPEQAYSFGILTIEVYQQ